MPTLRGLAVNFAFGSAEGITVGSPSLSGFLLQSANHGKEADLATVRNADGTVVTEIFHDERETAELRFVVTSSTSVSEARTRTTLASLSPGTIVSITACAARPDLVQTNWIVTEQGPRIEGDITSAAMVIIPLRRRTGITS